MIDPLEEIAQQVMETGREVIVEDSCGCVFCDLDLWPNATINGKPAHDTDSGVVACTKK